MVRMYKWQQVKALRSKGVSIKKIARQLKISKNTVRKYLRSSEPPQFKAREYEKVLNEYEDVVKEMLKKGYIGTRIYTELIRMGYKGSLFTVYRYIRGVKREERISKQVTTRVETEPGKQMQYDWKEWEISVCDKSVKIYIHEVVLSYSRKKYWNYSLSITSEDIIRAICLGINYFNGVPLELVIDNPKQMIITHRKDGVVRYNDDFLRFCGLYGIEPSPCRNYRARTKGKVERPFYYIQEHLLRGLELNEISEFDNKLNEFMEGYNLRLHSSLKESPDNRFEKESPNLREIPVVEPQILHKRETRKVTNDGYVSFDGSFYPVPMKRCLSELWVESFLGRIIKIYEPSGELISSFWINPFDKGIRPVHPEHKIINEVYAAKKREIKNALVTRFITLFGSVGEGYIAGLREATGANTYWHLSQILACCEVYTTEVISEVLKECIKVGAYHKNSVLRLLKPYSLKAIPSCLPFSHHGLHVEGVSRPLAFYAGIKEVCHE